MADIPQENLAPRPVISWGIVAATVHGLKKNFEIARNRMNLDKLVITPLFPERQRGYPTITVNLNDLIVQDSGFYPVDINNYPNTNSDLILKSSSNVELKIYTQSKQQLLGFIDLLTQFYLLHYIYDQSFQFPGTDVDYIAIGLQPGKLEWSGVNAEDDPNDKTKNIFSVSCNFKVIAEHAQPYELEKLTGVDIEAIPLTVEIS